ncbi:hypothetical protein CYMTET_38455 [Cymbomonas tetramitiformis]|uniref:Potassium channel domain-containing protein n=1 Tax=Cymbomonas tetramitiformis TaxID=36881 RepID=A0AAE0CE85_9CHLO|nr:hypothetical protein CYMTET_38455 [Cymbomonas tetramitiformis]
MQESSPTSGSRKIGFERKLPNLSIYATILSNIDGKILILDQYLVVLGISCSFISVLFLESDQEDGDTFTLVDCLLGLQLCVSLASLFVVWRFYRLWARLKGIERECGYRPFWTDPLDCVTFFIEVSLLLVMPIPFLPASEEHTDAQEILALLTFLRLYPVMRLFRDYSPIYKSRHKLKQMISPAPKFGIPLSVKAALHQQGLTLLWFTWFICLVIFGYVLYILERKHPDSMKEGWDNFNNVLWFSAVTMTTVGYGDMVPNTSLGRALACILCTLGIILIGFVASLLFSALELSPKAKHAFLMLELVQAQDRREDLAATTIQQHWRERHKLSRKHNFSSLQYENKSIQRKIMLLDMDIANEYENKFDHLEVQLGRLETQMVEMANTMNMQMMEMANAMTTQQQMLTHALSSGKIGTSGRNGNKMRDTIHVSTNDTLDQ